MSPSLNSRRRWNSIQTLRRLCRVSLRIRNEAHVSEAVAEYDKIPAQDKAVAPENQFVAAVVGSMPSRAGGLMR